MEQKVDDDADQSTNIMQNARYSRYSGFATDKQRISSTAQYSIPNVRAPQAGHLPVHLSSPISSYLFPASLSSALYIRFHNPLPLISAKEESGRVNIPIPRTPPYKFIHQAPTLLILQIHNFDPFTAEQVFPTDEGGIFTEYDARDFVKDAGASAHGARRECRVHCGAVIGRRGKAAGRF